MTSDVADFSTDRCLRLLRAISPCERNTRSIVKRLGPVEAQWIGLSLENSAARDSL
jgi:hypothetical protein